MALALALVDQCVGAGGLAMDPAGLAGIWEADDGLRKRARDLGVLVVTPPGQKWCEPNRSNATNNDILLLPALTMLRPVKNWHLPHLKPLQKELSTLTLSLGLKLDASTVYRHSVEIKKLMGLVKRKALRKEVTKAGCREVSLAMPAW